MQALTHDEVFQSWRGTNPSINWREHAVEYHRKLLSRYEELGLYLIMIAKKTKRPESNFKWADRKESPDLLFAHLSRGGNIAVVSGYCKPKLVILDMDSHDCKEEILHLTLTQVTPNGYSFFLREPLIPELLKALKTKLPKLDNPRESVMYELIEPSETCMHEHGSEHKHEGTEHDYRIRRFIDLDKPILSFKEFVKGVVSRQFHAA